MRRPGARKLTRVRHGIKDMSFIIEVTLSAILGHLESGHWILFALIKKNLMRCLLLLVGSFLCTEVRDF